MTLVQGSCKRIFFALHVAEFVRIQSGAGGDADGAEFWRIQLRVIRKSPRPLCSPSPRLFQRNGLFPGLLTPSLSSCDL